MEDYKKFMAAKAKNSIGEVQRRVNTARRLLADAEDDLKEAEVKSEIEAAKVEAFFGTVRKATEMPKRGEIFVYLDGETDDDYDDTSAWGERWNSLGSRCVVIDPAFGYCVRFTALADGMPRDNDKFEFRAGDLLEFLGVGAPKVHPGDRLVLTREDMVANSWLRHAMDAYDEDYDEEGLDQYGKFDPHIIDVGLGRAYRQTRVAYWPTIAGIVVSVEPVCSAFHLPKNAYTLEEAATFNAGLGLGDNYVRFSLREIYLPLFPELKAARKLK